MITYRAVISRLYRFTNIFMRYIAYFALSGFIVSFVIILFFIY